MCVNSVWKFSANGEDNIFEEKHVNR